MNSFKMYYSVCLKHPFTMVVSGPTGSGKTMWVKRLIEQRDTVSFPPPLKISYFYGEYQSAFDEIKNVEFVNGLDGIENYGSGEPSWIIIDDLMLESSNSSLISNLFTRASHHRNLSVILLTQNFFCKGKESRNISLNAQYVVLFKNPRDKSLATNIARQMYPNQIKKFQNAFDLATAEPFSYLFIDLKPNTPDEIRLMSHVLGENGAKITVFKII